MTRVIVFPPVPAVAFENTISEPVGITRGSSGAPRGSQTQAARRLVTLVVSGVAEHGAGYVEALKRILSGGLPLVEVRLLPMHWLGARGGRDALGFQPFTWADGEAFGWSDGQDFTWGTGTEINGVAGSVGGWPYLDCTGIEPGTKIVVGEAVAMGSDVAYVTRPVTASDITRLHLTKALPSGEITIGAPETHTFLIDGFPRAVQTTGAFQYQFSMVEVFADDFATAFEVLNPWR